MHPTMKRLLEAANDLQNIASSTALAVFIGESDQTTTNWKARGVPRAKHIALASRIGCRPEWLANGLGPMRASAAPPSGAQYIEDAEAAGFIPVRRVRLRLSAGVSGFGVEQDETEGAPIFFRGDWLKLKNWRAEHLLAVRITGESMQPNLFDGDLVVINTADSQPKDGEVFALNYEGELVIKRMRREAGGWWLDSDNPDRIRHRPRLCGEGCDVIGRVVYKQSERI